MLYFKNIKDYAIKKDINWKTAKSRLREWKIVELEFKKKKVVVELNDIIKFLLVKLEKNDFNQKGIWDWPSTQIDTP